MGYRYLLFHKPYDVLSQFSQPVGEPQRPTLKTFIPVSGVYPVGRLDRDSEGLMLLTDHGWLQHCLSDPRYGHPRTYWVQVEGRPTAEALDQLCQGVVIQGYRTRSCQAMLQPDEPTLPPRVPPIRYRKSIPTTWLTMTLGEGKNRQVRRMTAAVGYPTLRLVRVAIGPLELGSLPPGEWRYLTDPEQQALIQLAKGGPRSQAIGAAKSPTQGHKNLD
ncbi:MAG: pseudouridine synthase [Leptolyngbyaceae cyanobacterium SM2_5_2]|nr:pseudouridine synthase [Leptolyngbyaceae cyanobacterium SM2_5_2]